MFFIHPIALSEIVEKLIQSLCQQKIVSILHGTIASQLANLSVLGHKTHHGERVDLVGFDQVDAKRQRGLILDLECLPALSRRDKKQLLRRVVHSDDQLAIFSPADTAVANTEIKFLPTFDLFVVKIVEHFRQ